MTAAKTLRFAAGVVALTAVASAAPPAVAAVNAKPRNGAYAGSEVGATGTLPVSFSVVKRTKVTAFQATAQVKAGCVNAIASYQTPYGPFKIGPKGGFTGASSTYPKPAPTVRVTGTFVSRTKATGVITIKFPKKKQGCNASRKFTATLQP
jgi:hypothetical protein